jgi:hypothetical protein
MLVKITKLIGGAAAITGLLALALTGAGTAHADTNVGSTSTLAMVGSDTTMDVMEGLSKVITVNGAPALSNYLSVPVGRSITTRNGNAACTFTAPAGSTAGRDALSAAMRGVAQAGGTGNSTGCVSVARSSSSGNPNISPGVGSMTYVPFAIDGLTYASLGSSNVPHTLNRSDLIAIYTANTTTGCILEPLIPPTSSGTRQFWATALGLTDAAIGTAGSWGTCVKDTLNGTPVQEHNGTFLTNGNQLMPFSVAQYIAQASGTVSDIRGNASLGSIDFTNTGSAGTNPWALQTSFGTASRNVYNVVPTTETTNGSLTQQVFVGSGSAVCSNSATILQFGFATNPNCGSTTTKNTN